MNAREKAFQITLRDHYELTARRSHASAILFSNLLERVASFEHKSNKSITKEDVAYMIRNAMSDHAIDMNKEQ